MGISDRLRGNGSAREILRTYASPAGLNAGKGVYYEFSDCVSTLGIVAD